LKTGVKKEISFDGGLSKNIVFSEKYEDDFVHEKGPEWLEYRKEWSENCTSFKEQPFVPHLEVELNYSCNLRCPMCTWSAETMVEKKEDWFPFDDFKKLLNDAVRNGTKSIRFTYINEPLIRQDIDSFVKSANEIGILDTIITTNGTLLTEEMSKKLIESGLTKINVSLDAVTKETYEKVRVGGDFDKTVQNIKNFLKIRDSLNKKLPKLGVSFVRTKMNEHEYLDFIKYWEKIADHVSIQNPTNPFGKGKFHDPTKGKDFFPDEKTKSPKLHKCPEPFKRMTVRGNGDVLGCCSFYAVDLVVGNWKNESITDIWNGEKMKQLREIHKNGEYFKNPACKTCIENIGFLLD
jgi:radical SAM protein with 4Fe4S-binding SPASM domain